MASIEHGVGLTSICLALSNFLCNKTGKKTAYIELNASNEICALSQNCTTNAFSHMGVDIFPHRTFTSLAEVLRMDYDYFVLDMGILNSYTATEFAKFERQFLVCSLCKWKKKNTQEKLLKLIETTYIPWEYITILCNGDKKESCMPLSPGVSLPVLFLPFIANPFQLNLESISLLGKISGQY